MGEIHDVGQIDNHGQAERHQHIERANDETVGEVEHHNLEHSTCSARENTKWRRPVVPNGALLIA